MREILVQYNNQPLNDEQRLLNIESITFESTEGEEQEDGFEIVNALLAAADEIAEGLTGAHPKDCRCEAIKRMEYFRSFMKFHNKN